jgi:hypothetical protein
VPAIHVPGRFQDPAWSVVVEERILVLSVIRPISFAVDGIPLAIGPPGQSAEIDDVAILGDLRRDWAGAHSQLPLL